MPHRASQAQDLSSAHGTVLTHGARSPQVWPRMPTGTPLHACASRHRRERGVGAGSAVDLGQLLVGDPLVVVGLARLEAREQLGVAALEAVEVVVVVEGRLEVLRGARCEVARPARRRRLVVLRRLLGRGRRLLVRVEGRGDRAEVGGRRLERREGLALRVLLQRRLQARAWLGFGFGFG